MGKMNMNIVIPAIVVLLSLLGCSNFEKVAGPVDNGRGVAMVKISMAAGSPFQKLADSAIITVSASDMLTIRQSLTVTDSSVEGKVEGIPAGKNRLFTIAVYDSLDTLQYRGSTTADIIADSTVSITITIVRVSGGAVINTTVQESDSIPTEGLVAYYPFNGDARDESRNGNDGTVEGATLAEDRFGRSGNAYGFGGTSRIDIGESSKLLFNLPATISSWVCLTGELTNAAANIFSSSAPDVYSGYSAGINKNRSVYAMFGNGGGTGPDNRREKDTNDTLPLNRWANIVSIITDTNDIKIYINGNPVDGQYSGTGTGMTFPEGSFSKIGAYLIGKIDDVRIYDRALSDSEIQRLYHEGGWTGE
jgi:hypothetical protein